MKTGAETERGEDILQEISPAEAAGPGVLYEQIGCQQDKFLQLIVLFLFPAE